MPRTKGSKNKPKTVTADFATQLAEKQSTKEALVAEITSITANIDTLKADLKEKKTALKKIQKEVATLEAKKEKAAAKAAEEAKRAEAESVVKKLLASGMSAEEILEKLK
jgi:septal ring factor EnvC (AmiA/AmiB activator)